MEIKKSDMEYLNVEVQSSNDCSKALEELFDAPFSRREKSDMYFSVDAKKAIMEANISVDGDSSVSNPHDFHNNQDRNHNLADDQNNSKLFCDKIAEGPILAEFCHDFKKKLEERVKILKNICEK